MKKTMKKKRILKYILVPVVLLLFLEAIIFGGVIINGSVIQHLKQYPKEILHGRLINRESYFENEMINSWTQLDKLVNGINQKADELTADGSIDLQHIDENNQQSMQFLNSISDEMIDQLRLLKTTGVYVVFNNQEIKQNKQNKPCLYIRDLDPLSKLSANNQDLFIVRGPRETVKKLNISTDSSWKPQLDVSKKDDFIYKPFQEALHNQKNYTTKDLGYWSRSYQLKDDRHQSISYSIPLVSHTGILYGVVGIELTHEYLSKLLPNNDISEYTSNYCLAIKKSGSQSYQKVYSSLDGLNKNFALNKDNNDFYLKDSSQKTYATYTSISTYSSNTPFEKDHWVLMVFVDNQDLLSFANSIHELLIKAISLLLIVGIIGSIVIAYRLSKPITTLSQDLMNNKKNKHLSQTGISEIDQLVDTIQEMNENVAEYAQRFNKVIELSRIKLGIFEIDDNKNIFFLSDNFMSMIGQGTKKVEDVDTFKSIMNDLNRYLVRKENKKYIYEIPNNKKHIYIELNENEIENGHVMGLIEDITERTLEKKYIEFERDHDYLTGLYNRRAFNYHIEQLFQNHSQMKNAAFIMIDLDNLKLLNDQFGHNSGDQYLLKVSKVLAKFNDQHTLVSRMAGDEFNMFMYGYDDKAEIEKRIEEIKNSLFTSFILLENNEKFYVRASAGVSWYPRDSQSLEQLRSYADYAMYKIKKSTKCGFANFDLQSYKTDEYKQRKVDELAMIIDRKQVMYYYQPIVRVSDGHIIGYEALMRSMTPTLNNPEEILSLANQLNCLDKIEVLTMFHTMKDFIENIKQGYIASDSLVFINSIPSQIMSKKQLDEFEEQYQDYLSHIVVEVTENEQINQEFQTTKISYLNKWHGQVAIDDYGTGYNSGKVLLNLKSHYLKIDKEIVRQIYLDESKQKMVQSIVTYGHQQNIQIIAEGVETLEEMKTLVELDVDLLQGYLLGKPQKSPARISDDVLSQLLSLKSDKK